MPFNSFLFLLAFLPCALVVHTFACRAGPAWAKTSLIAASLVFYGAWAPRFLPLLLATVGGNLLLLLAMQRTTSRGGLAAFGVLLNLAVLGWFKYGAPFVWPDALLPLGISFFIFTQIGCLLTYGASEDPSPKVQDYALFVLFFPALTSGPILNTQEMLPQFERTTGWRLTIDNLAVGAGFFVIGLLKKTLLADPLSGLVRSGFADPGGLSLLPAWQTAAAWSLQLYFDFSGYTDMAIGLGWLFGFRFPDNFDQPYRARSAIAYWQCWHMSLTRLLVSNVHAPLTLAIMRRRRARGQPVNRAAQQSLSGFLSMIAVPIVSTMILVGVWHGPAVTFLAFGLFHAALLLVNHAWRLWEGPRLPPAAALTITYLSVLVGAVLFRAVSVPDAGSLLAGMAGLHGLHLPIVLTDVNVLADSVWIAALYGIIWLAPSTRQWMQGGGASWSAWRPTPGWAVAMGLAATLGLLASGGTGEFVYFHF